MEIPLATVEKIMRNAGAEKVASGAVDEMRDSVDEIAAEVAEDAVAIAHDDGRSKVQLEDIRQAVEA